MPMTNVLPRAAFLLVLMFMFASAQADDLKDISQMASQSQQAAALDRINAHLATNPKDVQALFIIGCDSGRAEPSPCKRLYFKTIQDFQSLLS